MNQSVLEYLIGRRNIPARLAASMRIAVLFLTSSNKYFDDELVDEVSLDKLTICLVLADLTVGLFVYVVRKRIKLGAEKAIFA
ncbi:autophagy-related protein 8a [Quercus suber]|uniref:Autophagy-related protein 8a n=1 Tax=Quercus suber TaxID=58331 RepID=A0AAW0IMI6_QUESU